MDSQPLPRLSPAVTLLAAALLGGPLVLVCAGPADAARDPAASAASPRGATEVTAAPTLFAEGWGLGSWLSGASSRGRVVQICVLTMCLALFILMRKLAVVPPALPGRPRRPRASLPPRGPESVNDF